MSRHSIEEAKAKLGEWVAQGSRAKVKIETIIVEGVAAEEILRAADRNDAELVREKPLLRELVDRREELSPREITDPNTLTVTARCATHATEWRS